MKFLNHYIDSAKTITGSDRQTAIRLNVRPQYICDARKNKGFSVECCRKLAEIINVNPLEVIAAEAASKADPETAKAWGKWQKKASAAAVVMILAPLAATESFLSTTHYILC